MKTKQTILTLALAAMLVAGFSGLALARGGGMHQRGMHEAYSQLSPEKKAAFEKLQKEHFARMTPLREQMFVKRAELSALERAQQPDVKAVSATAKELAEMQTKMFTEAQAFHDKVEKETGLRMGPGMGMMGGGMGHGMGHGMGRGMGSGMGPGDCPMASY